MAGAPLDPRLANRLNLRTYKVRALMLAAAGLVVLALGYWQIADSTASGIIWTIALLVGPLLIGAAFWVLAKWVRKLSEIVLAERAAGIGMTYAPSPSADDVERLRSIQSALGMIVPKVEHMLSGQLGDRRVEIAQFSTGAGESSQVGRLFAFERRADAPPTILVRENHGWLEFRNRLDRVEMEDREFSRRLRIFSDQPDDARAWATPARREFLIHLFRMGNGRVELGMRADHMLLHVYGRDLVRPGAPFIPAYASTRARWIREGLDESIALARRAIETLD